MTTDIAFPALDPAETGFAPLKAFELEAYTPPIEDHGLALVVADRGHVWLGRAVTDGAWTRIAGARVVRRWGTTDGLNQLVHGPRPETKLDAPADLKVATRAVIAVIPVEAAAWPNA